MTLESQPLGSGENNGDLTAVEWRGLWRLGGWAVEKTLVTLLVGVWRPLGRISGWGVETTQETWLLGNGDNNGDLTSVESRRRWKLGRWGVEMMLETAAGEWRRQW